MPSPTDNDRQELEDIARSLGMPDGVDITAEDYMKTYYPVALAAIKAYADKQALARERVALIEGIEYMLRAIHYEEGRLRQVANAVYSGAEYIASLRGEELSIEEFGSYKDYLSRLTQEKEG